MFALNWSYRFAAIALMGGVAIFYAPAEFHWWLLAVACILSFIMSLLFRLRWWLVFTLIAIVLGYCIALWDSTRVERARHMIEQTTKSFSEPLIFSGHIDGIGSLSSGWERAYWCQHAGVCIELRFTGKSPVDNGDFITGEVQIRPNIAPFDRIALSRWAIFLGTLKSFTQMESLSLFARIAVLRDQLLTVIDERFPPSSALVIRGMLIGDDRLLDTATREIFRISGLQHLLVASGTNVVVVLVLIGALSIKLPRAIRLLLAVVTVSIFVIIAGSEPPIVRAGVMGLIAFFVTSWGRRVQSGHLLLAVMLGFIMVRPTVLLYDAGFQLSSLAVAGLIALCEPLSRGLRYIPRFLALRESLAATLAATIFTLPILVGTFGQVSLVSPVANLLAAPLIALVMGSALITLLLEAIHPLMAQMFGLIPHLSAQSILLIAEMSARPSWAALQLQSDIWGGWIQLWLLVGMAIFLILRNLSIELVKIR